MMWDYAVAGYTLHTYTFGMKLALYSGGNFEDNDELNKAFISMLPNNPTITFIPSSSEGFKPFFNAFQEPFKELGANDINVFFADREFSAEQLKDLLQSDAIFLSGGNTFYFLKILKQKGLIEPLREFAQQGGVLAGMSAGSIIMTPNITMASIPSFDNDDNFVELKDLSSLNLTQFEFSPHYVAIEDLDKELRVYSATTNNPILACPEGAGIISKDKQLLLIGEIVLFTQGRKTKLV